MEVQLDLDCANIVYKMFLEMRAADLRNELQSNLSSNSKKVTASYYTQPVRFIIKSMDWVENEINRGKKILEIIRIYQYYMREFTQRFHNQERYHFIHNALVARIDPLIEQGMDPDLMNYFRACIPKIVKQL